jgi:hypothetical protein
MYLYVLWQRQYSILTVIVVIFSAVRRLGVTKLGHQNVITQKFIIFAFSNQKYNRKMCRFLHPTGNKIDFDSLLKTKTKD